VLAQNHEHDITRKDAVVQLLVRDIDAAEAQLLTARRAHMSMLDQLLRLQEQKLATVSSEFEEDLRVLKQEYREELSELTEAHARSVAEINEVSNIATDADKERVSAAKAAHETERERVRNANLEGLNELRITLENRIDELERLFDDAHASYTEQTREKAELFKALQLQDAAQARRLRRRQRALEHATREVTQWRRKTRSLQTSCEQRQQQLRDQASLVAQQCVILKARMARARREDSSRLAASALRARETVKSGEAQLEAGARVLQLAARCRELATERERVLPGDEDAVAGAESLARGGTIAQGQLESIQRGSGVGLGPGSHGEWTGEGGAWEAVDLLSKRMARTTLGAQAIAQEKARLEAENASLRALAEQFLAGVAVRPDAVDRPNPLLVVNGRVGLADAQTMRAQTQAPRVVVEGTAVAKQLQLARQ
jgi:DNA repair exonuclease SbcCD ATPase subunit